MSARNDRGRRREYRYRKPGPWPSAVWLFTVLALACPWISRASTTGVAYTMAGHELYHLELATGELTPLGDLGITGVEAMALDPSGALFAATRIDLFRIDPATPAATLVGPLGLTSVFTPTSMTFDANGRLWMAVSGRLYEVDPVSGAASEVGNDQGLIALADDGSELFGVIHGLDPPPGQPAPPRMVRVDKEIGVVEVLAPIEGLVLSGDPFSEVVDDMAFDGWGQAWLLAVDTIAITPPEAYHRIYRVTDLENGMVELVSERMDLGVSILMRAMALTPNRGVVAIPVLGGGGLAVLCAALMACALGILRRRPSRPS